MSSADSVASSFSSFASSSSSSSTHAATPQQPGHTTAEDEVMEDSGDQYSQDSFAPDDESESTAATAASACSSAPDADEYDDADYEDDAFEDHPDDPVYDTDNDAQAQGDYSADFTDDSVVAISTAAPLGGDEVAPGSNGSDQMETIGPLDQSTQHPGGDVVHLAEEWALHKVQLIQKRRISNTPRNSNSNSAATLHKDTITGLLQRLATNKSTKCAVNTPSPAAATSVRRVPSSLVERARVQHLLALSALSPPPPPPPPPLPVVAPPTTHSLSTFCSVKTADVAGRLATSRLSDLCATWHVPPDCGESVMSRGVMEFIASVTQEQRHRDVLRASNGNDCVFRAMQPQTVALERTVQAATDALHDSRQLLEQAQCILHAPDAHHCSCV